MIFPLTTSLASRSGCGASLLRCCRVMPPTVDLAEALSGAGELLGRVMDSADPECRAALYAYAAQIMSRNREMIPLTAEDLRDKYDTDVEDLVYFFAAYVDFVEGLRNAKN